MPYSGSVCSYIRDSNQILTNLGADSACLADHCKHAMLKNAMISHPIFRDFFVANLGTFF